MAGILPGRSYSVFSEGKELLVVYSEAGKCLGSIMKSYLSKTQLHGVLRSLIDTFWYFSLEICLCMKLCCLDLSLHDRFQLPHFSVLDKRLPLLVASASSRYGGGFELLDSNLLLSVYLNVSSPKCILHLSGVYSIEISNFILFYFILMRKMYNLMSRKKKEKKTEQLFSRRLNVHLHLFVSVLLEFVLSQRSLFVLY